MKEMINMWRQNIKKEMEEITAGIKERKNEVKVEDIRNKKVILYGAGIDGIKVLAELENYQVEVIAFFDMRADLLKNIKDIPVFKPDYNIVTENEKTHIPVILTVKPFKKVNDEIIKTLIEHGYKNIIKATDMFDFYSFTKKDISEFDRINSSIIECAQLLEDEESYKIYKGFIASHATKQYDTFSTPTQNTKYFDSDFGENKGFQRYIDCGAFDGDTLRDLNQLKGKVEKVALFESDMSTFKELLKMIGNDSQIYAEEMSLYPCGVWSDTVKLRANNGMELNSHISDDGDDIIQCVAIDQVLKGFNPTFVKIDVEGAEYQALTGARNTITENKPDIVISLYHDLRDIWELPLFIKSWDLGYKFYIRVYGKGGNATMLYAFSE
jgi:FkbM family methyltransferase